MAFLSFGLAFLAAAVNGLSSVLQRRANRDRPSERSLDLRSMTTLLRKPIWLAGIGTVMLSFVLSAAALRFGRLAAVQPVLVLELPLTLVFAAVTLGSRLRAREWAAAGAMTAGVAGVDWSLSPSAGSGGAAAGPTWAIAVGATLAVIAAAAAIGATGGQDRARRPAMLGVAAGMTFGLTAAFMKGMTSALAHGLVPALQAWQTYAMVASGLTGLFLIQSAFAAGRLILAQPGVTLADPVVAVLWGVLVFGERTRGGWYALVAVVCGAAVAAGVIALARSPALQRHVAEAEERDRAELAGGERAKSRATSRGSANRRAAARDGRGDGAGRLSTNARCS